MAAFCTIGWVSMVISFPCLLSIAFFGSISMGRLAHTLSRNLSRPEPDRYLLVSDRILFIVILMVFFSRIEWSQRQKSR